MKKGLLFSAALLLFLGVFSPVKANIDEYSPVNLRARITSKQEVPCAYDDESACFNFALTLQEGELADEVIEVLGVVGFRGELSYADYQVGDDVFVLEHFFGDEGGYDIVGPVRENAIIFLVGLFIVCVIAIGRWQGVGSIIGLVISIFTLFAITIPMIIDGWNPILAGFIGALLILIGSIYFSHGFNPKTTIALLSTVIGLAFVAILALVFVYLAKLTGLGDDNSIFLIQEIGGSVDLRGVLFSSFLIAGIGIIDDITVNQVAALVQIHKANPKLSQHQLYTRSMELGRDHVSSMVNTLFIAYASASMPLAMLWQIRNVSISEILNSNVFAEEIVRTIIGSLGLVLIVPIVSYVAAYFIARADKNAKWLQTDIEYV